MDLRTRKVEITAQNHGFAVDPSLPVMSVQYHPEAAPGPHDSLYLFREFRAVLDRVHG